jgi:hypothetical protein
VGQIVKNDRRMPLFGKQSRHCTTYVPGTSSNQYFHKKDCPFLSNFGNLRVYYIEALAK